MRAIVGQIKKHKEKVIEQHMPSKSGPKLSEGNSVEEFKQAFDKHWLDGVDESRFVEADGFHPSSLGVAYGKCARYQVYMLRGTRKVNTFDARTLRVLATGNRIHDTIQKTLDEMGILISAEIPIEYSDPPIKGHADGALRWDEEVILLEIKSCNSNVFEMRRKWKKPKGEHFDQANIYAYILGIETIWVLYYCKDNEEYEIFSVKADKKAAEKIINKWRDTYKIFQDGDLPKRPYKPDSQACQYCPLREHCYSDTEPGV